MLNSSLLPQGPDSLGADGRPACESTTGSYNLSKTYLRVKVDLKGTTAQDHDKRLELAGVDILHRPDRDKGYCLDYAASPTAHDMVKIFKVREGRVLTKPTTANATPEPVQDAELAASGSGLLHAISTDAIDESAYILKTIIRTIFIGISGNPNFAETSAVQGRSVNGAAVNDRVVDVEYDPFDLAQSALVNSTLSQLGFCIILQGVTVPRDHGTIATYCDDPRRAVEKNIRMVNALRLAEDPPETLSSRGVFYRPRIPFTVLLFLNANRGSAQAKAKWELRGSEVVELENVSPILAIDVERAFFAERKTTVMFDQGALTNVCVFKTSELVQFVDVPLEIAKSMVALPANIIQVQIDQTAGQRNLLAAQNQLMQAEVRRLQAEQALTTTALGQALSKDESSKVAADAAKSQANQLIGDLLEDQLAAQEKDANSGIHELNGDFETTCPQANVKEITAGAL
ncbi:hypothetical protein [Hyphomicrobium facile]|nr:hypothetical protein [Hyphomicrobium facile]